MADNGENYGLLGYKSICLKDIGNPSINFRNDKVFALDSDVMAECGLIHLQFVYNRYIEEMNQEFYQPFVDLLEDENYLILKYISDKRGELSSKICFCVYKLYQYYGKLEEFINTISSQEIENKLETDRYDSFRGDTLASRMIELYMSYVGHEYLSSIVPKWMEKFVTIDPYCDVFDPNSSTYDDDINSLVELIEYLIELIIKSSDECPRGIKLIFSNISKKCEQLYPEDELVKYIVISQFIFLRFFSPTLTLPHKHGYLSEEEYNDYSKILVLITRILTIITNFNESPSLSPPLDKIYEKMMPYKNKLIGYLDEISNTSDYEIYSKEYEYPRKSVARLYRQLIVDNKQIMTDIKEDLPDLNTKLEEILDDMRKIEDEHFERALEQVENGRKKLEISGPIKNVNLNTPFKRSKSSENKLTRRASLTNTNRIIQFNDDVVKSPRTGDKRSFLRRTFSSGSVGSSINSEEENTPSLKNSSKRKKKKERRRSNKRTKRSNKNAPQSD
eukprot:TRINITY_DN5689_c0_g1_i4.p1 TRINITY_DN5689_c0_g1~~TRINITY_DN5689_c0_g1_i4.p1  ORF type:complete len:504 (-),score=105.36 TRINITY_DN5689_c0_g1_i4:1557-3068(-)